ncbi:MAG: Rrf2 family transcriptional regulator [Archangium sp.]|nr:Rrf2 family transcriptional regulator [Archangium sp.]
MQHAFQISRKIEYGTRAMLFLASLPEGKSTSFREIARQMDIPEEFLAKILKTLVKQELVKSVRGSRGGYSLARAASNITFLEVIEAVEGPISVNVCTEKDHAGSPPNAVAPRGFEACRFTGNCTMMSVWRQGQDRMLDVYRSTKLDKLAMRSLTHRSPLLKA